MTHAQLLTPQGRGAIGVVRVWGAESVAAVDACFHPLQGKPFAESPLGAIRFGRWGGDLGEELIVVRCAENEVEVHSHGGVAAPEAVLQSLAQQGVRVEGAFGSVGTSLEADALEALTEARTEQVAAVLLDQSYGANRSEGALRKAIEKVIQAIDQTDFLVAKKSLEALRTWCQFGLHLTDPWRVVLAGPPNVGKSSLVNAIVGYQRAIVYDEPGTTRDVVTASTALAGWPITLTDTAGLHNTADPIEAAGVALARKSLQSADLVLLVNEASRLGLPESQRFEEDLLEELAPETMTLCVASKGDLAPNPSSSGRLVTSVVDGRGLAELLDQIGKKLVPHAPPSGTAIPFRPWHDARLREASDALEHRDAEAALASLQALLADGGFPLPIAIP